MNKKSLIIKSESVPFSRLPFFNDLDRMAFVEGELTIIGDGDSTSGSDPVLYVKCPWESSHSSTSEKSTMIFVAEYPTFFCHHAHCQGKTIDDVIEEYGDAYKKYMPKDDPTPTDIETILVESGLDPHPPTKDTKSIEEVIDFLGELQGPSHGYVLQSMDSKALRVISTKTLAIGHLLDIYSNLDAWQQAFPKLSDEGEIIGVKCPEATEWIFACSKKKGNYDPTASKGLGVHLIDNDYVINIGSEVVVGSEIISLKEAREKFPGHIFIGVRRNIKFDTAPVTPEEYRHIAAIYKGFASLSYTTDTQLIAVFGSIISQMAPPMFKQTPILGVTGPTGSGKSFIITNFIAPLIVASGGISLTGGTTSAGIEQALLGNVSAIIDEFEPSSEKNIRQIDAIYDLFLSASTTGAMVSKGTLSGVPVQRTFRCGLTYGSVGSRNILETIERRTVHCDLSHANSQTEWDRRVKLNEECFTPEKCSMVYRALYANRKEIKKKYITFLEILSKACPNVPDHVRTLYATTMCATTTVLEPCLRSDPAIADLVTKHTHSLIRWLIKEFPAKSADSSYENIRNDILAVQLMNDREKIMLQNCLIHENLYQDLLLNNGIKIVEKKNYQGGIIRLICFSTGNPLLKKAFSDAGMSGHTQRIKQLPGAENMEHPIYFKKIRSRAWSIPYEVLMPDEEVNISENVITPTLEDLK